MDEDENTQDISERVREPNHQLRKAREMRGWSRKHLAMEMHGRWPGIAVTEKDIGRWETGKRHPGPYYREKLCSLFETNAAALGFLRQKSEAIEAKSVPAQVNQADERPYYEERDWTTWFGLKQAQMLTMVSMWRGRALLCDEVQTMVDQEIKAIDYELRQHHVEKQQAISRRQALITIAAFPTALMWGSALTSDAAIEDFLPQSAASITTCWHLMKGSGFTTLGDILSTSVPFLATLALRPSKYQQVAARLATQASIIQGILAMHQLNFTAREAHCSDAVRYAAISNDNKLKAASQMYLGYTYSHCYYPRQPQKAIPIFQKALHDLGGEASLLRSDILIGLGEAYAQCGEEQEALRYLGLARDHFPAYPEHDPNFIYADCGLNTLYQWQGKTYLQLVEHFPDAGYQRRAADSLIKSVGVHSISARSTGETAIYQADAARVLGELRIYAETLRQATHIARDIGSQRRFNDAFLVYQRTPDRWIKEPEIQALAKDVFKQLPARKAN